VSELQHARIAELCGELRLGAVPGLYGATAQAAAARDASFSDFLEDTLRAEREVRRSRARGRLWLPRLSITTISPARRSGTSSNQQSAPSLYLER